VITCCRSPLTREVQSQPVAGVSFRRLRGVTPRAGDPHWTRDGMPRALLASIFGGLKLIPNMRLTKKRTDIYVTNSRSTK
jgi:hypothetical protein